MKTPEEYEYTTVYEDVFGRSTLSEHLDDGWEIMESLHHYEHPNSINANMLKRYWKLKRKIKHYE